jgi:hypothetical protein
MHARLWPALSFLLLGCSATASSHTIRTRSLVALIDITAERSDQAVVSADVVVGGPHSNRHVVLEGGDRLIAARGDEGHAMQSVGNGTYEARFAHVDGEFVVALLRGQGSDAAAPRSVGELPAAFEITSAYGDQPVSRTKDTLTLSWAPAGVNADVTIELEGDCIHSQEFQVPSDTGSFSIEPGKLVAWKSQELDTCGVALRVVRTRKGQPDPGLDSDSSVVLRQIRTTRFVSGP